MGIEPTRISPADLKPATLTTRSSPFWDVRSSPFLLLLPGLPPPTCSVSVYLSGFWPFCLTAFWPLRLGSRLLQDLLHRGSSLARYRGRGDLLVLVILLHECRSRSRRRRRRRRPADRRLLVLSIVIDETVARDATCRLVNAHVNCPPAQAELVTCKPCASALDQASKLGALGQQILEGDRSDGSRIRIRARLGVEDQCLELVAVLLLAQVQLHVGRIGRHVALLVASELCAASVVVLHHLARQFLLEPELGVGSCSCNHILIDLRKRLVELVRLRPLLVIANDGQIDGVLQRTTSLVVKGVETKGRRQTRSLEGKLVLVAAIVHVGTLCTHRPRDRARGSDRELSKLEILRLNDRRGHFAGWTS